MLMVKSENWLQAGLVTGVGLVTFAVQALAAILAGPAASGLTFHEAVAELGFRPVWVLMGWSAYCVLVTASILFLGPRNSDPPREGRVLRMVTASLWTCGAVGGPWFMVMNAAWGPLWEDILVRRFAV
ncbi:hypothetical protein FHS07_002838 [Microbacterium proteolyticum]|uniref:Uncharacterized protein n=2 Tax=Microbacterium proteolyticum TaxID=1572644 RepID=A0A7W5CL03_9MICO|nr:hypothetical protein [Microbacterium proteolyticum]